MPASRFSVLAPRPACRASAHVRGVPVHRSTRQAAAPVNPRRHTGTRVDPGGHSPDLRQQALTYGLTRVDAILFTHSHADHILGLDEIRRFNFMQRSAIPCYATADVWTNIRQTFHYIFDGVPRLGGGIPLIEAHEIRAFEVEAFEWCRAPLHGNMPILGFAFASAVRRCSAIPDQSWPARGTRGHARHRCPSRQEAPDALQRGRRTGAIAKIAPRRAYFTHMAHDLGHAQTNARLPAGVELAYDGLVLDAIVDAS